MKENEKLEKQGLDFKDFLDQSTNLITLFGVFNALSIYSSTIENKDAAEFLLPSFFILSIWVWFELILFTLRSSNKSKKYEYFYYTLCCVELGLIWFFVVQFYSLLLQFAAYGLMFLSIFISAKFLKWAFEKPISSLSQKKETFARKVLLISSLVLGFFLLWLISPITKSIFQKIIPAKVEQLKKEYKTAK